MTRSSIDVDRLYVALRRVKRDRLLAMLDRSIAMVPKARLGELVEGFVLSEQVAPESRSKKSPLDEVRTFHTSAMRGDYYEGFDVNSKNFMDMSEGTEQFIAEFERIMGTCVNAVNKAPVADLREGFDLLLSLLRHIDQGNDDVVFFADEGGSWQVGVDWRKVLPAYFKCLAASAEPDEFARLALGAIGDFADYDRGKRITDARRFASKQQKAALSVLANGLLKR